MISSSPLLALPFRCPVSSPLLAFVTFLNIASGRSFCFHSFSSVSAKADIRKRIPMTGYLLVLHLLPDLFLLSPSLVSQ